MDLHKFLADLESAHEYRKQLAHVRAIPPRTARFGELRHEIHPLLENRLKTLGVDKLYSHQAEAINAVMDGNHVIVVTPTASGKTISYNLPVLNTLLSNPNARALYIFPTKALAQDQLRKLQDFDLPKSVKFGIYDGDTPQNERRIIRRSCNIVLTNPDMLHVGILPYHAYWTDFFANLAFVVIDEMHIYRGVFGSHIGNVMRRLRRVCRHHGSVPQFIGCSATISNPQELMIQLTGTEAHVVEQDGSPAGEKIFAFWNPPVIAEGERRSANLEAAYLFAELVKRGIRNITFARARVVAELIYKYAREYLSKTHDELVSRIMSYRGGYTPEQRREIEKGLFTGELIGVTATNALELGIDVGHLDACILTGYPGTVASTLQQAGRAGRGQRSSLAILVALDNPLDQFIIKNPDYLIGKTVEKSVVDPQNPYILAEHLLCACFEIPISELDYELFGEKTEPILNALLETGEVTNQGRWYWTGSRYPAGDVNIRSTGGPGFLIYENSDPSAVIGSVDEASAYQTIHQGAVYLHQGETYVVERLDLIARCAYVSRRDVDYYTTPSTITETKIKTKRESRLLHQSEVSFGEVDVTEQVIGYRRKQLLTDVVLDVHDLDMPPKSFDTQAVWLVLCPSLLDALRAQGKDLEGGIHAVEHALIAMLPLYAMCDRNDVGGTSHPLHPSTGLPTVFIYDGHPGGVGIAETAYYFIEDLVNCTLKTVRECPCNQGCPSCIQSPKCGNYNFPLDKEAAVAILESLCSA